VAWARVGFIGKAKRKYGWKNREKNVIMNTFDVKKECMIKGLKYELHI